VTDLRLSQETKRACFRAQVVAIASGQTVVTTRDFAAAALHTDEVRALCEDAGVSAGALTAAVDPTDAFPRILGEVERALVARGDFFGSRSHVASLRPLPATQTMRQAFVEMEASGGAMPVDLLRAIVLCDPQLENELAARGLTAAVLPHP
jgi:hypothetical protein